MKRSAFLTRYSEKIKFYSQSNAELEASIKVALVNYELNKDILLQQVESLPIEEDKAKLTELMKQQTKLNASLLSGLSEKRKLEIELFKYEEELETRKLKEKVVQERLSEEFNLLSTKIKEKEQIVAKLKSELDNKYVEEGNHDVFVTEPTKELLELNNEFNYTKEVLDKITVMLKKEKETNIQLEEQNKGLISELDGEVDDSDESDESDDGFSEMEYELKSPHIEFEDKVDHQSYLTEKQEVPKLNLVQVKDKWHNKKDLKVQIKQVVKKETDAKVKMDKSELKMTKKKIVELKKTLDSIKSDYKKLKMEERKTVKNVEIADGKIGILESKIKSAQKELDTSKFDETQLAADLSSLMAPDDDFSEI